MPVPIKNNDLQETSMCGNHLTLWQWHFYNYLQLFDNTTPGQGCKGNVLAEIDSINVCISNRRQ
jgi:hypothetical protein